MLRIPPVLFALALVLLLANPASAEEPCYTTSTTDDREIVVEYPADGPDPACVRCTAAYVVVDTFCLPGVGDASCLMSVWIYPEANGIPGLQRGDEVKNDVANCQDGTTADATVP